MTSSPLRLRQCMGPERPTTGAGWRALGTLQSGAYTGAGAVILRCRKSHATTVGSLSLASASGVLMLGDIAHSSGRGTVVRCQARPHGPRVPGSPHASRLQTGAVQTPAAPVDDFTCISGLGCSLDDPSPACRCLVDIRVAEDRRRIAVVVQSASFMGRASAPPAAAWRQRNNAHLASARLAGMKGAAPRLLGRTVGSRRAASASQSRLMRDVHRHSDARRRAAGQAWGAACRGSSARRGDLGRPLRFPGSGGTRSCGALSLDTPRLRRPAPPHRRTRHSLCSAAALRR